jgi:DNA polymerase
MADFLFIDFETRGPNLKKLGPLKYALDDRTTILMLAWALDRGPTYLWVPGNPVPDRLWQHVRNGGLTVAWNAAFDRHIWQQIAVNDVHRFPPLFIEQTLDAMAQAQASGLPGRLDRAGIVMGLGGKAKKGKGNLKWITDCNSDRQPTQEEWADFCAYALRDVRLMQQIWYATRPLSAEEWREYWASEQINDRGMGIDVELCLAAASYKAEDEEWTATEVTRLTGGVCTKQTQSVRLSKWVYERLDDTLRQGMVKEYDDETGDPSKLTLGRQTIVQLLDDIQQSDHPPADDVTELLELLLYGRSSSAAKFQKMADQSVDGRLCSSHVFNGAGQTGRYSSRGVQTHNLPRDPIDNEAEIINMVLERVPVEELRKIAPVSKILSRLIRPAIIAP